MSKYISELKVGIKVEFMDEAKAKAYFINGDWGKSFWQLDDMEDLTSAISFAFFQTEGVWSVDLSTWTKFLEGFGEFVCQAGGIYQITENFGKYGGKITVQTDSKLEVDCSYEVSA